MALDYRLGDFTREVDFGLNQTLQSMLRFIRDLFATLAKNTPVDTGFAKNRWSIGKGSDLTTIVPVDQGEADNTEDAVAALIAALGEFKNLVNSGLEAIIVIYNDAKYISFLDQGHSDQAKFGIVEVSIQEVESKSGAQGEIGIESIV